MYSHLFVAIFVCLGNTFLYWVLALVIFTDSCQLRLGDGPESYLNAGSVIICFCVSLDSNFILIGLVRTWHLRFLCLIMLNFGFSKCCCG